MNAVRKETKGKERVVIECLKGGGSRTERSMLEYAVNKRRYGAC